MFLCTCFVKTNIGQSEFTPLYSGIRTVDKRLWFSKSLFSQNHLTRNENEKQIPNIKVQELLSKETFAKTTTAKILKRNKTGESVVQIRI